MQRQSSSNFYRIWIDIFSLDSVVSPTRLVVPRRAVHAAVGMMLIALYAFAFLAAVSYFVSTSEQRIEVRFDDSGYLGRDASTVSESAVTSCSPLATKVAPNSYGYTNLRRTLAIPGNAASNALVSVFLNVPHLMDTATQIKVLRTIFENKDSGWRQLEEEYIRHDGARRCARTGLSAEFLWLGFGNVNSGPLEFSMIYDLNLTSDQHLISGCCTYNQSASWTSCYAPATDELFETHFRSVYPELRRWMRRDNGPFMCTTYVHKSLIEAMVLAFAVIASVDVVLLTAIRKLHTWLQLRWSKKKDHDVADVSQTVPMQPVAADELKVQLDHSHVNSEHVQDRSRNFQDIGSSSNSALLAHSKDVPAEACHER